jgi:2-keto-4-pentenoate hydratase/2-oxohepta-3-ene-1,7-dioic acid hydratase in catechol pathway
MKIIRYTDGKKTGYGIWRETRIESLVSTPYRSLKTTGQHCQFNEVNLLAPCSPSKIVALGLNYRSHAEEFNRPIPTEPLIFLKPSTSVIGPEDNIIRPASSQQVDYEGELAVVIKDRTWQVSREKAMDHILGYTCFNDVTARDLQAKDKQWTRAKSFDTFAAIGPCIETELDAGSVYLETYLNGELKQRSSTSDLIFSVPELVSFISHVMTLLPGDVIATGTPSGVGPMQSGDTVEVKVESIGTLRNHVV